MNYSFLSHLKKIFPLFEKNLPILTEIYITPDAGNVMESVKSVQAIENKGLVGDRYHDKRGYWKVTEACQVTVISKKDVEYASKRAKTDHLSKAILAGDHRRNLVINYLDSKNLIGKKFKIGEVMFSFKRQRPPCGYIDQVSQKDMCRSLGKRSGCCVEVISSGMIHVGDALVIIN